MYNNQFININGQYYLNSFVSGNVQGFCVKKMDRTWLCTSVTLVPKVVESCSKAQKTQQVF